MGYHADRAAMQIAIADAKSKFAELIRRAEAGEEIQLTRYGRPVARLTGLAADPALPLIGALRGKLSVTADELAAGDARIAEMFGTGADRE
jgi:prevent-host-death family protein